MRDTLRSESSSAAEPSRIRSSTFEHGPKVFTTHWLASLKSKHASPKTNRLSRGRGKTSIANQQEAKEEDIIVAVLGVTGAGKSSFIATLTGRSEVKVGHDLESGNTSCYC